MKTVTLEINTPLADKKAGDTITLECDRDGVVLDRYWRRRIEDAKTDNCVTVVKKGSKTP